MSAALVVVDLQVVLADPDSPWATPGSAAVVPPARSLVEAFDAAGAPVVLTRSVAPAEPAGVSEADHERALAVMALYDPLVRVVDAASVRTALADR